MNQENRFTVKCISCNPPSDEENITIMVTRYGRVVLRLDDQGPIGRCIFVPFEHIFR